MKPPSTKEATPAARLNAWRPALVLTASIMFIALVIMLGLSRPFMARFSGIELAMLDAVLLGATLTPIVYYLLMAPLRRQTIQEQQTIHEMHDELTGLPTRKLFMELMEHETKLATRNGWPLALIVVDPARFYEINQIFGYGFGDKVLAELATRLRTLLRQSDIVARISGDEFGLLLQKVDMEDVPPVVRKISAALETQFLIDDIAVDIGVTMGAVVFPHHGDDDALLLRRARVALSKAKSDLDAYSLFEREYESAAEDRIHLFGEIRHAIVQDEFELYFQPKVHMPTGHIVGAEALVRLNRGSSQEVSDFILFAEQTGIITDITHWVFGHAVAQLATWRDAGLEMDISVNISVRDLLNEKLMDELSALCAERDIGTERITLEITESAIMRQADKAILSLERLREKGFRISLDDFGTGYSSLSYLMQLPADELKIDQSFVRAIEAPAADDTLIGLIVDIGNALGMKIIAEGVETSHQSERLLALGCDTFQGYMVSRPLPAHELASWHHHWTQTHQ